MAQIPADDSSTKEINKKEIFKTSMLRLMSICYDRVTYAWSATKKMHLGTVYSPKYPNFLPIKMSLNPLTNKNRQLSIQMEKVLPFAQNVDVRSGSLADDPLRRYSIRL